MSIETCHQGPCPAQGARPEPSHRHTRQRFRVLTVPPFRQWLYLLCFLCGAAMPFLELVPFSSSLLGTAVVIMATALLARDGLLALLGSVVIGAVAVGVPLFAFGVI